ncbi:autotransporter outer membrane beta-barrel domain-containing protein [Microbulbifer sp. CAU 1566]|uniref:autotransporter outer membrane beta-barrel domain-containing protein n=1 Tax=Microbulbifer sp. CAU 1566 TaxID=2933269 RepID=UPI002002AA5B|nr:autotransporter outer membrane beta-barrel domain-containing protein [Microbulbifer sp. CAU 1566]MCK7597868.1 autotransporter outer membrane beta-barrel domain-containing protein [Microbulbifer sp. CAU 1566]
MADNKGFPSSQSQLTSAVRKALFTSAAVTAIAMGTPGYAAAAEIACAPGQLGAPAAGDTVTCSGVFDETINYDVVDATVIDPDSAAESILPGDINVVVAEGSTASGITVTSVTAAVADTEATGSIVIENHGDIAREGDAGIEVPDGVERTYYDMGIRVGSGNSNDGGHFFDSYMVLDENGKALLDEDGNPTGERILFTDADGNPIKVAADELDSHLGVNTDSADYGKLSKNGPEDKITFLVAEEGTFEGGVSALVNAETEAGSISITNTGDISVGSGQSVTYYSAFTEKHSSSYGEIVASGKNPFSVLNKVDVDGDGVADISVWTGEDTIFVDPANAHTATVFSGGISASSTSGNIVIENAGTITAGNISKGVNVFTESGDIAISNSGDIATGDASYGISASSAVLAMDSGISYSYNTQDSGTAYAVEHTAGRIDFFSGWKGPSYTHFYRDYSVGSKIVDSTDSVIEIGNSGSISVGEAGVAIHAKNPSGAGITIINSGDIDVADGVGGAGIYASTSAGLSATKEMVEVAACNPFFGCPTKPYFTIEKGEASELNVAYGLSDREDNIYSHNANGDYYTHEAPILNLVGRPTGYYTEEATKHYSEVVQWEATGYFDDRGDIAIANSGTLDLSGTLAAAGITAVGHGTKTILNSGDIEAGALGTGIGTRGVGETVIDNQGNIYLNGAGSAAIQVEASPFNMDSIEQSGAGIDGATVEAFGGFENGDVIIANSGFIGGADTSHLVSYNENGALESFAITSFGINVSALGSNLVGSANKWTQYGQATVDKVNASNYARAQADMESYLAGEITIDEVYEYTKIEIDESIELTTTSILNTGDISLSDQARGINVSAKYGTVVVENQGSISVGNGVHGRQPETYGAVTIKSTAINVSNFGIEGLANHLVVNRGDVFAGDVANGIRSESWHGSSSVFNEGNVTVGSGHLLEATDESAYAHGSVANGISSVVAGGNDAYAFAHNSGNVTTGDRAFGMVSSNVFTTGTFLSEEFAYDHTAAAINTGVISTGDYATGMGVNGYMSLGYNSGSITIGSGPMQNLNNVEIAAGMRTLTDAGLTATLLNTGDITGGDEAAGMFAEAFFARSMQSDTGSIIVGDNAAGLVARGQTQAIAENAGVIQTGDASTGIQAMGTNFNYGANYATAINTGSLTVGDDSLGIQAFGTLAQVVNTGTVTVGDSSVGVQLSSAILNAIDAETGEEFVRAGAVVNQGTILASGEGSLAIQSTEDFAANIVNRGLIEGSVSMGAGDDFILNGFRYDADGYIVGVGKFILDDASIDMGAGANNFSNQSGDIVFSGDSRIDVGAKGTMLNQSYRGSYVTISSVNDEIGDKLTIRGDVEFTSFQGQNTLLLADIGSRGSDRIVIHGDVTANEILDVEAGTTQSSNLRLALNVTDQGKGRIVSGPVLVINGEQDMDSVQLANIGGDFADTILSAELRQDGGGNWVVDYTAGLSDLGTAASSISHLAESFWLRSSSAFFDGERSANGSETGRIEGLQAWSSMFTTNSDVAALGALAAQDLTFSQSLGGQVAGATYSTKLGDSWLSFSPLVGLGTADGSQLEQSANAKLDTKTYALTGSWSMRDFYANAMYQVVDFDANVRAHDSAAATSGKADGVSVEAGWTYLADSGMAVTPFAQWDNVGVDVDSFSTADGNFDYDYALNSSKRARLGLNMRKSFKLSEGFAMPYATFSVSERRNADIHNLHANGIAFESDVSGTGFNVDFGIDGKYQLWTFKSGLGIHSGDVDKNGISGHLSISRSL